MFRNLVLVAFRNLLKYKTFSTVNLLGLTVGLTCFLLIGLWIRDETSYDRFHVYSERLYRVMENSTYSTGEIVTQAETPGLLGEALKNEVPELVYVSSMDWWTNTIIRYENRTVKEEGRYVGNDFLKMFSFPLLQGDKETALASPNSIVLSKRLADKIFPGTNPMGKVVKLANFSDYQVTGVCADVPANSIFNFEFLLPYNDFLQKNPWAHDWNNNGLHTWVMLDEGADVNNINQKIKNIVRQHGEQDGTDLFLQPLTDVYLKSDFKNGVYQGGGRYEYVRLFGLIGLLILLLAGINFVNLSTARAAVRAKEVSVRKVVGAGRKALFVQFNGEALLLCALAMTLSVLAIQLILPTFNDFTGKAIQFPFTEPATWLLLGGIVFASGILAGSYPAVVISAFRPAVVLKGNLDTAPKGLTLRKTLVVAQFGVAVFMAAAMLVVHQQLHFLQTKNLGYERDQLLLVDMSHEIQKKFDAFRSDLERTPGVLAVSAAQSKLPGYINATDQFEWPGKNPEDNKMFVYENVAPNYLTTIGASLAEGRDFSKEQVADGANFVINETAAKYMGLAAPVVGQRLKAWGKEGQIVGVVKDFHFTSLKDPVQPLILMASSPYVWTACVRVSGQQTPDILNRIEGLCKKYSPAYPFEYQFADDTYNALYKSETTVSRLATLFAILAMFISCLGLFGLATFTVERRVKEIGIRKVLGASTGNLIRLLSGDFLKLVGIGIALATPAAWWATKHWLNDFAYHIHLSGWVFALTGALAIAVAFLTVSFHSVQAALSNPVNSLRNE